MIKNMRDYAAVDIGLCLCTDGLFGGIERAAAKGRNELNDAFDKILPERRLLAVNLRCYRWLDVYSPEVLAETEHQFA